MHCSFTTVQILHVCLNKFTPYLLWCTSELNIDNIMYIIFATVTHMCKFDFFVVKKTGLQCYWIVNLKLKIMCVLLCVPYT